MFLAVLLALPQAPAASAPVNVKPVRLVSFNELIRMVKAHKGKVVVVDFWDDG